MLRASMSPELSRSTVTSPRTPSISISPEESSTTTLCSTSRISISPELSLICSELTPTTSVSPELSFSVMATEAGTSSSRSIDA